MVRNEGNTKEVGKIAVHLFLFLQLSNQGWPFRFTHHPSTIKNSDPPSIHLFLPHNPSERTWPFPSRFKRFWFQSALPILKISIFFCSFPIFFPLVCQTRKFEKFPCSCLVRRVAHNFFFLLVSRARIHPWVRTWDLGEVSFLRQPPITTSQPSSSSNPRSQPHTLPASHHRNHLDHHTSLPFPSSRSSPLPFPRS
ncbi:hypothetical protein HOY82DRAFT_268828 [Tuber indicum]|nr:hypothetical protein HOY82DRAFT_268828 [Tuber indicum]